MKNFIKAGFLFLLSLTLCVSVFAGKKTVRLRISEADAKIYIDGQLKGAGQIDIVVPSGACVTVKAEKTGFLVKTLTLCNKPDLAIPPKTYFVELEKDDAYDASETSDVINTDIEIKTRKPEAEAWKVINQVVTSYFDDIEMSNRETGYLKTGWALQTFKQNTVRTRLIVKPGSTDPVSYKIRLASEQSGLPQTNPKSDEHFRAWDRVLSKYKLVVHEIEARLGS